ncbi:MAG: hypothetical protein ACRBN8_08930 [Nannocystales bacterium]
MSNEAKFPALTEYLASVPHGLDSYPDYWAKASLYRGMLEGRPLVEPMLTDLPLELQALVEHPVPVSSWMPEVHSHALMLAIYDTHFGDLDRFVAWAYDQQRALFTGPLYSVAMRLVSPGLLFKTAAVRFRMFHRGASLAVVERRGNGGIAKLEYPPCLYDSISRAGLCAGLRAALDLTVSGQSSIEVIEAGDDYALLSARWDR